MKRSILQRVTAAVASSAALAVVIGVPGAGSGSASAEASRRATTDAPVGFGSYGSLSAPSGKGSFRFGVATSATQIEDQNTYTDWYDWTQPAPEGLGHATPVGDAVGGYTRALDDVELVDRTNVDSYRFGIEWTRIEQRLGVIDHEALRHYDEQLDALVAKGIHPMITVNHFALPTWVDNPRDPGCADGPSDTTLCGLDHPQGGAMVVQEMAGFARLLARHYGDRVRDWVTINEPMVYMLFAHGFGVGPAGKASLNPEKFDSGFVPALRNLLNAQGRGFDRQFLLGRRLARRGVQRGLLHQQGSGKDAFQMPGRGVCGARLQYPRQQRAPRRDRHRDAQCDRRPLCRTGRRPVPRGRGRGHARQPSDRPDGQAR